MGRSVVVLVMCAFLLGGAMVMDRRQRDQGGTEAGPGQGDASPGAGERAVAAELAQAPAAAPARGAAAPPASVGRLTVARVSVPMPSGYGLAVEPEELAVAGAREACEGSFDYCLYAVDDAAKGLAVNLRGDLRSDVDCALEPLPGFEGSLPGVGGTADHVTARFDAVSHETAGGVVTVALDRLRYGGVCYEFVSRVAAPDGPSADEAGRELAAIVDGVRLPDGRSGLWVGGR